MVLLHRYVSVATEFYFIGPVSK